jgi:ferritin-like metal-binding protein YciE
MKDQNFQMLVAQGLQALKAGSKIAKEATAEIQNDARDPQLRSMLQQGNQVSEEWTRRIEQAIAEVGSTEDTGNPVLEARHEVSRQIRQKAPDDLTRDLGIIAAGQLALHYWIAAFGTLGSYAASLGMSQTKQAVQASLDEAKQADQQHTDIAERLLANRA